MRKQDAYNIDKDISGKEFIDAQVAEAYVKGTLRTEDLFLSTRSYNCLTENRIYTLTELQKISDNSLLSIGKLGVGSLNEIRHKMDRIKSNVNAFFNDDSYYNDYEFLKAYFDKIDKKRKIQQIRPYIHAYTEETESLNVINKFFGDIEYVYEIDSIIEEVKANSDEMLVLKCFIKYLTEDVNDVVKDVFNKIYRTGRLKYILEHRAAGEALEEVGRGTGITRERVRQLEDMIFKDFTVCNKRKRFLHLFAALYENTEVVCEEDINSLIKGNAKELIYILKSTTKPNVYYNKKYNLFTLNGEYDFNGIEEYMSSIQTYFKKSDLDYVLNDAVSKLSIPKQLVKKVIEMNFTLSDTVYCNIHIGLGDKYSIVLKNFYPSGIKLFDKHEAVLFRKRVNELFGKIRLPSSDKAIESRLVEIGVLCDRGMYIHPDYIKMPQDMIEKIDSYITNNERIAMSYLEIFEYFKDELLTKTSIDNRYYLQGVLRYFLKDKYHFTRDLISKDQSIDFVYELKAYVKEKGEVTKEELKRNFMGVSDAMFAQTIMRCKEIITIDYNTYIYYDCLNITKDDYKIKNKLNDLLTNLPVSCRNLYTIMKKDGDFTDFFRRNSITNYSRLYGVLKYMFANDFEFSRPNIALKGTEDPCNLTIVRKYLRSQERIDIEELFKFCEENQIKFIKKSKLINRLSDEFFRNDVNELIPQNNLDLSEDKITAIKVIVLDLLDKRKYIALIGMKDFTGFPDLGVQWTPFLLISIAQKYLNFLNIVEIPTRNYNLPNSIFVKTDNIYADDYKELVRWIIKLRHEEKPFRNLNEVHAWLTDEGVIIKGIPIYLTAKKLLYMDEQGKVVIR